MALHEANVISVGNGKRTGAEFPSLNSSVEYIKIGCPWHCNKTTAHELRSAERLKNLVPNRTTHLVFHLGHHYNATRLKINIQVYEEFLSTLSKSGIHVIIRSMNAVHFKTTDGEYHKNIYIQNINSTICSNKKGVEGPRLNTILEQLAERVGGKYFDIYAVSDDRTVHPEFNDGKKTRDCRHVCRNCDMLRTWNSLLIRLF